MSGGRTRVPAVLAVLTTLVITLAACTGAITGHGTTGTATGGPSSASGAPESPTAPAPTQPQATFQDCSSLFNLGSLTFPTGRESQLRFTCTSISVPLDYADPNGRTIELGIVRVHDEADTHPEGQLLVNPGGPGASGVDLAVSLSAEVASTLLDHYDLIGFDPRGVGLSTPIKCLSDAQKDRLNAASPDVLTSAGFTQAKNLAAVTTKACESQYGSALQYFNTVETARDMDQIREAVGDAKMNYLGFSYGTELGSAYAHLFPKTVRVMVLDGAVDPLTSSITASADQLQGFEGAFDQFAIWCRTQSPCKTLGNPRQAVYAIQAKATASPIPSSLPGEARRATFSLVTTGVLQALYSKSLWPELASSLIAARGGNSSGLLALADQYNERYHGQYTTNIAEANTTISCNDSAPGPSDAQIRATARSWKTRFPMFGLWSAPSLFACQQWQPHRTVPPKPTAATPHTVLVVGNLHDPATPYQGAIDLARTMGNAEVLTWNGEGHTSYLQGSSCIDDYVNAYLVSGTDPPEHRTCPA